MRCPSPTRRLRVPGPRSRRFLAALLLAGACRAAPPAASVTITSPAAGDTVPGGAVHVTLAVSGVELAPVAEQRPGTAHHHLYLDADFGEVEEPIPAGLPHIIHLGLAQTEYHWDSVAPGPHRIIAVLADPAHIPLRPLAADTVTFTVAPPPASPPPPQ